MKNPTDFTDRTKLATVYLPIELGAFNAVMLALQPLMDCEGPWNEQVDSDGEHITFYAPKDAA